MWNDERLSERFNRIDERFDRVDERFDRVERRMDRLETQLVQLRRDMFNGFLVLTGLIVTSWVTTITTILVR